MIVITSTVNKHFSFNPYLEVFIKSGSKTIYEEYAIQDLPKLREKLEKVIQDIDSMMEFE